MALRPLLSLVFCVAATGALAGEPAGKNETPERPPASEPAPPAKAAPAALPPKASNPAAGWTKGEPVSVAIPKPERPPDYHQWRSERARGRTSVQITLPKGFEYSEVRLKRGDGDGWAEPGWDDRDWEIITDQGLPARTGVFWIRYRVRGPGRLPGGLAQQVGAAFELYWDGKLVGRSGEPADDPEEEVPGKLDTYFSIPVEWLNPLVRTARKESVKIWQATNGGSEHIIALRMSNYRFSQPGNRSDLTVVFTSPEQRLVETQQTVVETALATGALAMVALASLTLWLVARRRRLLLFFTGLGLGVCAALVQFMLMARDLGSYDYSWHYPLQLGAVYLAAVLGAGLLGYVGIHFKVARLRWLFAGYGLVCALMVFTPRGNHSIPLIEKAGVVMLAAFVIAAVAAGWAAKGKQRGAALVMAGCLVSAATAGRYIAEPFFPTFLPATICLLGAVALRLRDENRAAEAARLAAARLELELLKKNLQPHFVLNSLTVLAEVVEQDPSVAGQLIQDLAGVFRALARMSGEKQVSLAQELDLCRAHLRVMSVRTGIVWRLETDGVALDRGVPPALFLTLIENGHIHQRVHANAAAFQLSAVTRPDGVAYTFISPGEVRPPPGRTEGGTGLRYVKARLEESFPGRWSLTHGPDRAGWATVIELKHAAHPS